MKYIVFLSILLLGSNVIAQQRIPKQDTSTYLDLLDELHTGNVGDGLIQADSLYTHSITTKNKLLKILMLNILAIGNSKNGSFKVADNYLLEEYKEILSLSDSYLKDSLLVENLNIQGDINIDYGDYPKAASRFHESLSIAQKIKDTVLMGRSYNWLGNVYAMQGLLDDAIFYYEQCLKNDRSVELKNVIDSNLGNIYSQKKEYDKAEEYYLKALETTHSTDIYGFSILYNNLGLLNTEVEKYQKAHTLFLKADKYASQINNEQYQLESKLSLVHSFLNISDYSSANVLAKKCDSLGANIESNLLKKEIYEALYLSYAKMNKYQPAFENVEKYMAINDSILGIEKIKVVKDLKIKHESDLKEAEIVVQLQLINMQKKQNSILTTSIILLLALMGGVVFLYKQRISTQKKLLIKQEELATQKVTNLLESQRVESYESHLKGQNKERERIAKDLHDSVSGNLAAIKMKLTDIKLEQSQEIDTIIESLDATYNEVRSISHNLIPQGRVEHSFIDNIHRLTSLYDSIKIKFAVDVFPENKLNDLPLSIQVELYRVLQELITNIVKHAKASKGNISITLHHDYLNVIVEDNGIGYNTNAKSVGIGLSNIMSRIKSINGSIDIDSVKEKGTSVNINIPIV